jgi:hypothetical protein
MMNTSFDLIWWDSEAPDIPVEIKEIDHFDARGLRRVYGRGDHFGRYKVFNMDIWKTGRGILLMRCWSHCDDIEWKSFEIRALDMNVIPKRKSLAGGFLDTWVPKLVRDEYEYWIKEEF